MLLFVYASTVFILLAAIAVSKKEITKKVIMGGWISFLWWGGDPDEVNPISGLSRREVYLVKKSWAPVAANSLANGTELLRRYFTAYPEAKNYFKMFKSISGDFTTNVQFKAHVVNLMSSLTLAVNTMDQPELVVVMMNKLGESHHRRKIKEQNFHDLKEVIVKLFIEVLKMDDTTLGAWSKTVDFWYKHIFPSLNEPEGSR